MAIHWLAKILPRYYKSNPHFFEKKLNANNSKSYWSILMKFGVQKDYYYLHPLCKFQINRLINNYFRCVRKRKILPPFFAKYLKANNSKSYWSISVKFRVNNNHHSIQVPCKFQINRFINNQAIYDLSTRAVDDQGTRAVGDPITRVVDDQAPERSMIGWRSMIVGGKEGRDSGPPR